MSDLMLLAGPESLAGSVNPLLGIVAIRIKCLAPDLTTAILAPPPAIGVGLVENQPRTFSRNEAGDQAGYIVEITLEGHLSPDAAPGEEYSLDGSTSDDPIESHPDIQLLLDTYDGEEKDGKATWEKTIASEDGSEARNPMHGVESYLVPGLVWTKKSVSKELPASIVANLGAIDIPSGKPPPINGKRQWFKIRVRASWRGNVWEIEESWQLTGPYGVAPELYRRTA